MPIRDTLDLSPQDACHIALLARERNVKQDPTGLRQGTTQVQDHDPRAVLERGPANTVDSRLRAAIERLSLDEQRELVGLVWLGRGDFTTDDWDEIIRKARERAANPTADYLMNTPLLNDHIANGLQAIGFSMRDLERDLRRVGGIQRH